MATSIFRKDSRIEKPDEDVLSLSQFSSNILQQKQANQLAGSIGDLGNKINSTPTITIETVAQPDQLLNRREEFAPKPENFLPSEVIQFCYNGRPAEFRMYGGFIKFL